MAVSVNRCCGGASIGSTCRPSARSSASSAASRWIGTLVAASVLVLATHVATAGAEDAPQPPAMPTMPTIAVQVDVQHPGHLGERSNRGRRRLGVDRERGGLGVGLECRHLAEHRRGRVEAAADHTERRFNRLLHRWREGRRCGRHIRDEGPGASSGSTGATSTGSYSGGQRGARSDEGYAARRSPQAHGGESGDPTTRDRAAEERNAGRRREAIRCHSSTAASHDASARSRRRIAGPRGGPAGGAHEGQPLAPPTGTAGGSPLPGVSGGLVLLHDQEAEEGVSRRTGP